MPLKRYAIHEPPSNCRVLEKGEDVEGIRVAAEVKYEADLLTHGWRAELQRQGEAAAESATEV